MRILTADAYGTPAAPENFDAQGATANVQLTWSSNPGVTGYLIERRPAADASWTPVTTLTTGAAGYIDDELLPGSRWFYRIHTFNAAGISAPTAETEVILPTNYSEWKTAWGIAESTPPDDDSDHDGNTLVLEYSLDLSPVAPDSADLPSLILTQDSVGLRFLHARPDIVYSVESSGDCVAWTTDGVNQGTENLWRVAVIPLSGEFKRFVRLKVQLISP